MKGEQGRSFSPLVHTFSIATPFSREISAVHVEPEMKKGVPIVYAIGWGTDTTIHKSGMKSLAARGYDTWSVNPVRIGKSRRLRQEDFASEIEMNKATSIISLLEAMNRQGIDKVDMVTHSEGAIYATIAALQTIGKQHTAQVRSLILVEPAGLMAKDSVLSLTTRFTKQGIKNIFTNPSLYIPNILSGKGMLSLPVSFHEAAAIAHTKLPDLLRVAVADGIKVGIISGTLDTVFPSQQIEETMRATDLTETLYKSLPIRHNGMYAASEIVMEEVDRMIQVLSA